ncbi:MAG: PEP-CTERM sorting domain-containing protein [Armatimonadetes bacterium]|nr:PEP-CTERM sorting domain-containing protein [Armatimonadota bacterium]
MEQRIFRLIIGLAVVTMLITGSIGAASAYLATGISSNKVYNFQADTPGGPIISSLYYQFGGGATLGGIAVSNGYAFISDTSATSGLLHVLRLGSANPFVGTVELKSGDTKVVEAGGVAVDANGGVYVLDKTASTSAMYAYVNPNFSNIAGSTVSLGGLGGFNPQVGIAARQGSGAVILTGGTSVWNNSYAAAVVGAGGGTPTPVDSGVIDSSIPSAITVNGSSGNAYIVTRPSDVAVKNGQLFAVDPLFAKLGISTGLNLPGVPHSVAVAGTDVDFLAIIGQGSAGGLQAWKVALESGSPTGVTATAILNASDNSALHSCASSSDGNMLWFTSPASQLPQSQQTVGTLDLTNWTDGSHPTMNFIGLADGVSAIAAYDYVPEPSSLISLLGLAAGAFTALRRRPR